MIRKLTTALLVAALLLAIGAEESRAQTNIRFTCKDVFDLIMSNHGNLEFQTLLIAGGERAQRIEDLEKEVQALEAEWLAARYDHEQDMIADRLAYPEAALDNYRAQLDCILNEIERRVVGNAPDKPRPGAGESKRADELKRISDEAAKDAERRKKTSEEAKRRRIPGSPYDTGINFEGGFAVGYLFDPKIEIGRGAGNTGSYHKTDEGEIRFRPSIDISAPLGGPDGGSSLRFGLRIDSGFGNNRENFGDSGSPGFITIIDGSNPALTPITASQNAKLKSQWWAIAGNPYVEWRRQVSASTWVTLRAGPHFEHERYEYDFRELVSGGGPFFSHNLDYDFTVSRYGVMLGFGVEQRLGGGFGWRAGGHVVPSWREQELKAKQSGTALGAAQVKDDNNGFGVLAALNAGWWMRLSPGIRLSADGGVSYRSDAPTVRYPTAGGQRLRGGDTGSLEATGRIAITVRLLDSPVRSVAD